MVKIINYYIQTHIEIKWLKNELVDPANKYKK